MDPDVTEDTRETTLKQGPDGWEGVKAWTVVAASKSAAMAKNGVDRIGFLFTDRDGAIPDALCLCRDVTAAELKPARAGQLGLYKVTANYGGSSDSGGGGGGGSGSGGGSGNSGGVRWQWGGYTVTQPVDLAFTVAAPNGARVVPIVDRAGRPFDPPLTDDFPRLRLTLRWVSANFDPWQYFLLQGSVNFTPFWGIPMGIGKLESIGGDKRDDGLVDASLVVDVNPDDWDYKILDLLPAPQVLTFFPRYRDWSVIPVPA